MSDTSSEAESFSDHGNPPNVIEDSFEESITDDRGDMGTNHCSTGRSEIDYSDTKCSNTDHSDTNCSNTDHSDTDCSKTDHSEIDHSDTHCSKIDHRETQHSKINQKEHLDDDSLGIFNTNDDKPTEIATSTPQTKKSKEVVESDEEVIDISSEREDDTRHVQKKATLKKLVQPTLNSVLPNKNMASSKQESSSNSNEVSPDTFAQQREKVSKLQYDVKIAANALRTINLEHLHDKGKSIKERHAFLENLLLEEVKVLNNMKVQKNRPAVKILSWEELETKTGLVQPKTFGKQAISTYNAQKSVTMDRLHQLHGSLETCPKETDLAEDPIGLKINLMQHQRRALTWIAWREKQKPSGGILADDMGLGKTLTMISLIIKTKGTDGDCQESDEEDREATSNMKYNGGTLIVCPASLINQWSGEIETKTKRGLLSWELYHGAKRETKPKRLAQHDAVITTYSIVNNEVNRNGAIFQVKWRRIILDEAHQIRNYKSQTSMAVCQLSSRSRWALTGTPVHNKEVDMYALLKYLRCTPFDDLQVWKRWISDKNAGGQERLHTVISSLMLRRTKAELIDRGSLNSLPEKKSELIPITLNKNEMDIYNRILVFSRTLFAQFLHQRAERNQDNINSKYPNNIDPNGLNQEYFKMRKKILRLHKVKDIKQHEILVLLLRLRQICCHPSLIIGMLHDDIEQLNEEGELEHGDELDLLEQINRLTLEDESNPNVSNTASGDNETALGLSQAVKGVLNPSNPIFLKETMSSKIRILIDVLKKRVIENGDKAIIVSQWSSFLKLIGQHLEPEKICFDTLDGSVPVCKRMNIVDNFNNAKSEMKVLLLSLTAGGVGLNLVGANHLFLLDLHWNPQLENQAQDRIYRVGQLKPVFVYKLMASDTIEKRILDLQEKKLEIANSMLIGTKQIGSQLSLQDLRLLFEM